MCRPPTVFEFRVGRGALWDWYVSAGLTRVSGCVDAFEDKALLNATMNETRQTARRATFGKYHQPNNSGTDGQGSYLNEKLRSVVSNRVREISISRNPDFWQCLPAEGLVNTVGFIGIEEALEAWTRIEKIDVAVKDR